MNKLYYQFLDENSNEVGNLLFKVTLLDDDPLFIEQMKDYLTSMKISNIESFSSGEEFLSRFKESDRRLIVCDYDFGSSDKMNGLQVLIEIKKRNPEIPVIIISSQDKMATALQVLKSGAMDYFIKGTENAFTSVMTSIIKYNELQRVKKNEADYMKIITIGSVLAGAVILILVFQLIK